MALPALVRQVGLAEEIHLAVGFVADPIAAMLTIRAGRVDQAEQPATRGVEPAAEASDADAVSWCGRPHCLLWTVLVGEDRSDTFTLR
jgi:hypothetical protein